VGTTWKAATWKTRRWENLTEIKWKELAWDSVNRHTSHVCISGAEPPASTTSDLVKRTSQLLKT
jgi:hypothetical protein